MTEKNARVLKTWPLYAGYTYRADEAAQKTISRDPNSPGHQNDFSPDKVIEKLSMLKCWLVDPGPDYCKVGELSSSSGKILKFC